MQVAEVPAQRRILLKPGQSWWVLPMVISVALMVPCFWRPIVSGVDLQSHLYNAWLAELIRSGSIHGLWIGRQDTNILVDVLLSWLLRTFGVSAAERVVSSALVLIFFWGAFHFMSAVRGKPAYWLAPWLAILCYGYTFQMGFLNYYLSCGIVLWLFAAVWDQRFDRRVLLATPLLILAYVAHPVPVMWFLGLVAYCWVAQRLEPRFQILVLFGGVAALFVIRGYVAAKSPTLWSFGQLAYWTGADQALVYGWLYIPVALAFFLFSVVLLSGRGNDWRSIISMPAQAYLLTAAAIVVLPTAIHGSAKGAWGSHIADRLSLLAGVLLLAILGRSPYKRWYLPAGVLVAAVFFGMLYGDIGRQARVEAEMETLVKSLPAGERVVSYPDLAEGAERGNISTGEGKIGHLVLRVSFALTGRLNSSHLISRACLGHCFDYMNYEPSTGQFRIHALPGNPIVLGSWEDVADVRAGSYVVKARDLPIYVLFRCGPGPDGVILRPLPMGEPVAMVAREWRLRSRIPLCR